MREIKAVNKNDVPKSRSDRFVQPNNASSLDEIIIKASQEYTRETAPIQPTEWEAETITGQQLIDNLRYKQGYVESDTYARSLNIRPKEFIKRIKDHGIHLVKGIIGSQVDYFLSPDAQNQCTTFQDTRRIGDASNYKGDMLYETIINARSRLPARDFTLATLVDLYPGIYRPLIDAGGIERVLAKTAEYLKKRGNPGDTKLAKRFDYKTLLAEKRAQGARTASMDNLSKRVRDPSLKGTIMEADTALYLPVESYLDKLVQAIAAFASDITSDMLLPHERKMLDEKKTETFRKLIEQIRYIISHPDCVNESLNLPDRFIRDGKDMLSYRSDADGTLATLTKLAAQRIGYQFEIQKGRYIISKW